MSCGSIWRHTNVNEGERTLSVLWNLRDKK